MNKLRPKIKIRIIKKARREDISRLYKDAGWWKPQYENSSFINKIATNSFCFTAAFDGSKMVGMGRCLSDGVSDAYILDTVVLKKYRGSGIGNRIIEKITKYSTSRGIDWITVIAKPGTDGFYRKSGFGIMRNFVPLKLRKTK